MCRFHKQLQCPTGNTLHHVTIEHCKHIALPQEWRPVLRPQSGRSAVVRISSYMSIRRNTHIMAQPVLVSAGQCWVSAE